MSRLVRLLSATAALRPFVRIQHAAAEPRLCRAPMVSPSIAAQATSRSVASATAPIKRAAAVRTGHLAATPRSGSVRVYRGHSGTTMVGKIDAICRMIDRCIADERAAMVSARHEASRSA